MATALSFCLSPCVDQQQLDGQQRDTNVRDDQLGSCCVTVVEVGPNLSLQPEAVPCQVDWRLEENGQDSRATVPQLASLTKVV